ncbi:MATE family efflux transporter, partial [Acinetobacter baumannii]
VRRTVRMALWLSALVSLVFMAVCAAGGPIMRAMGPPEALTTRAASFLLILMLGMFPMIAAAVLRIFVSALGRPTIA